MELEELIKVFENKTPVVLHRPNEDDLSFKRIVKITPRFDKHGQPDYIATVEDKVGCLVHCAAARLEVAVA